MEMRTSVIPTLAKWLSPLVALSMLGCPKQELAPLGPCTVSAVSERVDQSGVSDVDLLFMIDNSGSMASEQSKLAKQLPKLVEILSSGDRFPGQSDAEVLAQGNDPTKRKFTPVKTLHLGVVSSNAGGIDDTAGQGVAIQSCVDLGDDGKLQNSTEIAQMGVVAANRSEFQGYDAGQTVIAPDPTCAIGDQPLYQEFMTGDSPEDAAQAFGCVARLGIRGCPFEQQLESMWKAVAPTTGIGNKDLFTFINGSKGQGDRYNKGFVRDNAILAVLLVSDEEDCSITDDGKVLFDLSDEANTEYGEINLRCGYFAPDETKVQAPQRYIDGLNSLKPDNPDRIIFGAIVGVPQDAIASKQSIEDILARDDMQFAERLDAQGKKTGLPVPSCTSKAGDEAYPPSRMLRVAQGFQDSVIYSICEDDYGPALDTLIEKIASKLKGNCLPRQLTPGADGTVNCEVFELLPQGETKCDPAYGLEGSSIDRVLNENGKNVMRKACKMNQLKVIGTAIADGNGWYYDNFNADLMKDCSPGEQQRISFRFANNVTDLPSGAGATFECFQPVARVDNKAEGFDAVNSRCSDANGAPVDATCSDKEGADGYKLFCQPDALTCQISCANNPDCPPGWVCAQSQLEGGDEAKYCQLPTCPQDTTQGG